MGWQLLVCRRGARSKVGAGEVAKGVGKKHEEQGDCRRDQYKMGQCILPGNNCFYGRFQTWKNPFLVFLLLKLHR